MRGLLVSVGQLDHHRLAVWWTEERDSDGEIVAGKSGRHCHRRRVPKERVQRRSTLVAEIRRDLPVALHRGWVLPPLVLNSGRLFLRPLPQYIFAPVFLCHWLLLITARAYTHLLA